MPSAPVGESTSRRFWLYLREIELQCRGRCRAAEAGSQSRPSESLAHWAGNHFRLAACMREPTHACAHACAHVCRRLAAVFGARQPSATPGGQFEASRPAARPGPSQPGYAYQCAGRPAGQPADQWSGPARARRPAAPATECRRATAGAAQNNAHFLRQYRPDTCPNHLPAQAYMRLCCSDLGNSSPILRRRPTLPSARTHPPGRSAQPPRADLKASACARNWSDYGAYSSRLARPRRWQVRRAPPGCSACAICPAPPSQWRAHRWRSGGGVYTIWPAPPRGRSILGSAGVTARPADSGGDSAFDQNGTHIPHDLTPCSPQSCPQGALALGAAWDSQGPPGPPGPPARPPTAPESLLRPPGKPFPTSASAEMALARQAAD